MDSWYRSKLRNVLVYWYGVYSQSDHHRRNYVHFFIDFYVVKPLLVNFGNFCSSNCHEPICCWNTKYSTISDVYNLFSGCILEGILSNEIFLWRKYTLRLMAVIYCIGVKYLKVRQELRNPMSKQTKVQNWRIKCLWSSYD